MPELYIFNQDDELLTIISEDNGLLSAPIVDLLNNVDNTPFEFTVESHVEYKQVQNNGRFVTVSSPYMNAQELGGGELKNVSPSQFVIERNRVVFKDIKGDYREFVISEIEDVDDIDGTLTTATCEPAWMFELRKNFILDKRYSDKTAQQALDDALVNTRYVGDVQVSLGTASTNFYRIRSTDAIWKIMDVWGGNFKDTVDLNSEGRISQRNILIVQRRGKTANTRLEIDNNIESLERTVISDPITAVYGWGASLETENGGHTRYIDFGDIEWKVSNGDPVDKPKGQKWVGDPDALLAYGLKKDGQYLHLYDEFSNQNYEDKEDLLHATWSYLQDNILPEVNYVIDAYLVGEDVGLGDDIPTIDRNFSRPIEIQTRVIGVSYDLMDPEGTLKLELGQFLSYNKSLGVEIDEIKRELNDTRSEKIHEGSYPDIKPDTPTNVKADGLFKTIMVSWDYDTHIYASRYEVYGSKTQGFVPDSQYMLWRGDVSSYVHDVDTDETWYYRVRTINTNGTASDYSEEVNAATVRVISDDILFNEDIAEKLRNLSKIADILADDTLTMDMLKENVQKAFVQENLISHNPDNWGIIPFWWWYDVDVTEGDIYTLLNEYQTDEVGIYFYEEGSSAIIPDTEIEVVDKVTFTIPENAALMRINVFGDYNEKELGTTIKLKLIKGDGETDWTPHLEDVRVDEYAYIQNGVIGTAAIANAAITKAKLGTAVVGTAQIEDAAITKAKIGNLAVDTAQIANGAITNAKIDTLNVTKLVGNIADFVETGVNGISSQLKITGSGLTTYSGGLRTSLLDGNGHEFYNKGTAIGHIGTANWHNDDNYKGLAFNLEPGSDYMTWAFKQSSANSTYTTMLAWHKTSSKAAKGFVFYDNVNMGSNDLTNAVSVNTQNLRTMGTPTIRRVALSDMDWNGATGFAFVRNGDGGRLWLGITRAALIDNGNAHIEVSSDGTGNRVHSTDIWNRTYSGAANAYVTSAGTLGHSTSSEKYKLSIENQFKSKEDQLTHSMNILNLDIVSWYDKVETETYAREIETGKIECDDDFTLKRHVGLTSERVLAAGFPEHVEYNSEGGLEGLGYSRLWIHLIPVTKHHNNQLKNHEDRLLALEEKLNGK